MILMAMRGMRFYDLILTHPFGLRLGKLPPLDITMPSGWSAGRNMENIVRLENLRIP